MASMSTGMAVERRRWEHEQGMYAAPGAAVAEARRILAVAEVECCDVASTRQIARASTSPDLTFRRAHVNIRGALAEALAGFIAG